ncbi:NAD(+) synthase [Spiroplasma endosymbiont of Amphibalanus improvisus]|uniref:NAD(+) synthase n=1 Tax=Spiroplasma endosymbiont of Amphibalanus improvisus TaxID=3066327 RepID=UPI00313CA18D
MSQKITDKKNQLMTDYINYLTEWIREKVKEANCVGVIVGVSGGVDSALVSRLGQLAFPENHLTVIMPCDSVAEDKKLALELIEHFKMNYQIIDITKIYRAFLKNIKVQKVAEELSQLNIKPRLRMTTLYALAQDKKYLVLGTDNLDELYIGYFTKHGDGASDIAPIANLLKNQVFLLARHLQVPHSILIRQPTAGLYKGQTDESELGFSYDQLDNYLQKKPVGRIISKKIRTLHKQSNHKRNPLSKPDQFLFDKKFARLKNEEQ